MKKQDPKPAANGGKSSRNGSGREGKAAPDRAAKAGAEERAHMKTYHEREPFPGRIGRTWDVSEPAFPVPREAPKGAPNILLRLVLDVRRAGRDA